MTRLELLKIVVGQARSNGFEFRHWFIARLGVPWTNAETAFTLLESERRYYALLFSHEFARTFWKAGSEITFQVPRQTFQRIMPDGTVATITRKPFTRRSTRQDVWRYHLREMAAAEDPLRYIRKYLRVEGEVDAEPTGQPRHRTGGSKIAAKSVGARPEGKAKAKGREEAKMPSGKVSKPMTRA